MVRINLEFVGDAYIDGGGALWTSPNPDGTVNVDKIADVNDLAFGEVESALAAQVASQQRRRLVHWAAYSEDVTVYEVNNEGVRLPRDQQDDDFVRLFEPEEPDATPVPLGQLLDAR